MYNNETAGPAFEEFLDLLGQRVRLKGFSKYRAQLDNKSKLLVGVRVTLPPREPQPAACTPGAAGPAGLGSSAGFLRRAWEAPFSRCRFHAGSGSAPPR